MYKLQREIHQNNKAKGFYDEPKNIGEMLALIHSEVSEALECDRKDKICGLDADEVEELTKLTDDVTFKVKFEMQVKDTFEDELADIAIRVLDLAHFKGVNLEKHIRSKMRYNTLRPHKHGKKY